MADAKTVRLRGEGGVVWDFELPLTETYADQVRARKLEPEDDESAALIAEWMLEGEPGPEAAPEAEVVPDGTLDLEALAKMKLPELIAAATDIGVDADTIASFAKPGTSKKIVIEAIIAADAAKPEE